MRPDHGRVACGDRTLLDTDGRIDLKPERRRVGLVYQDGALFPHLSVAGNVAYGLPRRGLGRAGRARRTADLLARFDLTHLAGARPPALSGGERRRVALARAAAPDPDLLLLDEPLTGLDAVSRAAMAAELASTLTRLELPCILVSHSLTDVLGLAGRVAVMERGHVLQTGPPSDLLRAPASAFVAAFAGVNYIAGTAHRRGDLTEVAGEAQGVRLVAVDDLTGPVGMVVYPWDVSLAPERPEGSALNALAGPVTQVTRLGNRVRVTVGSVPAIVAEVTPDSADAMGLAPGRPVVASWKATGTRLVPRAGSA